MMTLKNKYKWNDNKSHWNIAQFWSRRRILKHVMQFQWCKKVRRSFNNNLLLMTWYKQNTNRVKHSNFLMQWTISSFMCVLGLSQKYLMIFYWLSSTSEHPTNTARQQTQFLIYKDEIQLNICDFSIFPTGKRKQQYREYSNSNWTNKKLPIRNVKWSVNYTQLHSNTSTMK